MSIQRKALTQQRLIELLSYSRENGHLILKYNLRRYKKAGDRAGRLSKSGYRYISIDGISYQEHRIVWLYEYGYLPENEIDHINRIKDDNRIDNLREVSRSCNIKNIYMLRNNSSGVKGVVFHKLSGKWMAQITVNYKNRYLGLYENKYDAVKARLRAEKKYNHTVCIETSSSVYMKNNRLANGE